MYQDVVEQASGRNRADISKLEALRKVEHRPHIRTSQK